MHRLVEADLLEHLDDDALDDLGDDVADHQHDQEADQLRDEREERVQALLQRGADFDGGGGECTVNSCD